MKICDWEVRIVPLKYLDLSWVEETIVVEKVLICPSQSGLSADLRPETRSPNPSIVSLRNHTNLTFTQSDHIVLCWNGDLKIVVSEILHLPNQLWIVIKGSWWECRDCPLLARYVHYTVPCLSSNRQGRVGTIFRMKWNKMLTILTGKEAWPGRDYYEPLPILYLIGFPGFPANTLFFFFISAKIGRLFTHLFSYFWFLIVSVLTPLISP